MLFKLGQVFIAKTVIQIFLSPRLLLEINSGNLASQLSRPHQTVVELYLRAFALVISIQFHLFGNARTSIYFSLQPTYKYTVWMAVGAQACSLQIFNTLPDLVTVLLCFFVTSSSSC